ncbi:MAG: cupin domain-containing protein [Firmicutes bacterium]|nr:cupin domain-containing protein [Bacillota bacterium]
MNTLQIIKVEELPVTTSPRGPKVRKVLSSEDVAIMNVVLEPGETLPAHVTPVDVFFYIRSGSGTVIIGDDEGEVFEGDIVVSPRGIPHGLKANKSETFSVLVVKTPNPEKPHFERAH